MDDFVVFHHDKSFLWQARNEVIKYLSALHLKLHEGKCRIFSAGQGVPFLGLMIFPERRRLRRENYVRYRRRLKRLKKSFQNDKISWHKLKQSIQAWIGHARHADTVRLREFLLGDFVF